MDIRSFLQPQPKPQSKPQPKPKRDYSTHHFKHEHNPRLEEMRQDWLRRYWEHMNSPKGTFSKEWRNALLKEQPGLWSHRSLMCYD